MIMANCRKTLPQEGSSLTEIGESFGASALSPTYSGGDNNCLVVRGSSGAMAQETAVITASSPSASAQNGKKACGRRRPRKSRTLNKEGDLCLEFESRQEEEDKNGEWYDASTEEDLPPPKISTAKRGRGRGRSSATGKYVSFLKKKEDLKKKREDRELTAEEEVTAKMTNVRKASARLATSLVNEEHASADLNKLVLDNVDVIVNVATKSSHLKGTFQKALKDAAASIKEVTAVLLRRTVSEETAKLQADNVRLQADLADIRKELAELKSNLPPPRVDMEELPHVIVPNSWEEIRTQDALPHCGGNNNWQEELVRSIMIQVGGMINARFEGLKDRLLPEKRIRPSLAADKNRGTARPDTSTVPNKTVELPRPPVSELQKTNKRKNKEGTMQEVPTVEELSELSPATVNNEQAWTQVVRKGRKNRAENLAPQPGRQPLKQSAQRPVKKSVKLNPPRSAAVVITLQPGAEERGVTYSKVLAEARGKINLTGLGITELRFRQAATGGRILEIPGTSSSEKADTLAEKLRESLNTEDIKVSRPNKCAVVRISGLDDSITVDEVISAVMHVGGCLRDSIKSGEIRQESSGLGAVWVRCPVIAAKKLAESGRLLVGWVAAQVKLLQPRPMRCYRCLEVGHVRLRCTSEADRSMECYRCGKPGHKVSQCTAAEANCSLCLAANKPAGHRLGSVECAAPNVNRKGRTARAKSSMQQSHPPVNLQAKEKAVSMDTV